MTQNFTLDEFTFSQTAARRRPPINNSVPPSLMGNALGTLQMLERIRAELTRAAGREVPIQITSGYRSQALNAAVRGSRSSDHLQANAADWIAPRFGTPYEICRHLAPMADDLGIGQIIHEFGRWVHCSTVQPSRAINRIITISSAGTSVGIVRA